MNGGQEQWQWLPDVRQPAGKDWDKSNRPGFLQFLWTAVHVNMSFSANTFSLLSFSIYWHPKSQIGSQERDRDRNDARMRPKKERTAWFTQKWQNLGLLDSLLVIRIVLRRTCNWQVHGHVKSLLTLPTYTYSTVNEALFPLSYCKSQINLTKQTTFWAKSLTNWVKPLLLSFKLNSWVY